MQGIIENAVAADSCHRESRREAVDLLRRRAALLDGKDAALMQTYLEAGSSYSKIARLVGVSETTVARRIRAMTRRLVSGPYLQCLRHHRELSSIEMSIAKHYYLQNQPIDCIAAENGWSYYRIRTTVAKINGLVAEGLLGEHKSQHT